MNIEEIDILQVPMKQGVSRCYIITKYRRKEVGICYYKRHKQYSHFRMHYLLSALFVAKLFF